MITVRVSQSPYDRGYAPSREEAMVEFKARWGTADPQVRRQCANAR
jgi:hypothetical protein